MARDGLFPFNTSPYHLSMAKFLNTSATNYFLEELLNP